MFLESPVNLPAATLKIAEDEEGTTKKSYNHKKSKAGKLEGLKTLSIELLSDMRIVIKKTFLGFLLSD